MILEGAIGGIITIAHQMVFAFQTMAQLAVDSVGLGTVLQLLEDVLIAYLVPVTDLLPYWIGTKGVAILLSVIAASITLGLLKIVMSILRMIRSWFP